MPGKRKREDEDDSRQQHGRPRAKGAGRKQAEAKIHHGKQLLHRALKLAKGFERQKLSRRQKTAQKEQKDADIQRIEAEIEALKLLDLHAASEIHVHKAILKEKALRESPLLPTEVSENAKVSLNQATANITARLWASAPVKKAMEELMGPIRIALGHGEQKSKKVDGQDTARRKQEERKSSAEEEDVSVSDDGDSRRRAPLSVDMARNRSAEHSASEGGESEDDGSDFAELDDRVGGSSDDESLDLDAARADDSNRRAADLSLSPSPEHHGDVDDNNDDDDDGDKDQIDQESSQSDELEASEADSQLDQDESDHDQQAEPLSRPTEKKYTDSLFMPSLTAGYISGSESEASELDDVAPRKNRRGQRARQRIWEAKYGAQAKHVGKKQEDKSRDAGWDSRRGARDVQANGRFGGRGRGRGGPFAGPRPGRKAVTGANSEAVASKNPMNRSQRRAAGGSTSKAGSGSSAAALHPSWEAARKAKEARAAATSFAGTRVTFD